MKHDNYAWVDEITHPKVCKTTSCFQCSRQCREDIEYTGENIPYVVPGIDVVRDCKVSCSDNPDKTYLVCNAGDFELKNHNCAHCKHSKMLGYAMMKEELIPQRNRQAKETVSHALYTCKRPHRGRPSSKVTVYRAHCMCDGFEPKENE